VPLPLQIATRLDALPRRRLGILPSPLRLAPELGAAAGIRELWIKRDELLGFGFGGNKVRGLEFLLADALAQRADILVTGAGPQSNHVRATAAAAAHAGLEMHAIFWGDAPAHSQGNLALTRMLGARCHFTGDGDRASVDRGIELAANALRAEGRRPYTIPRGGACGLGVLGHVVAVRELEEQCAELRLEPVLVFLSAGSGGTLAGWLVGRRFCQARFRIEAVTVSRPAAEVRQRVGRLASEAASLLGETAHFPHDEIVVHDGFIGSGYGVPTPEGLSAIRVAARAGGIFLDPTYTGKAFAGLVALAREGRLPDGPVVFVHSGGEPALFAHAEALQ